MNTNDNMSDKSENRSIEAEVKHALGELRQHEFASGFADRAFERWNRERLTGPSTFALIERRAWQFLPIAVAASLFVAVYSARLHSGANSIHSSLVARTLGWPSNESASQPAVAPTYESVYATLYGLPELNSTQGVR